MLPLRKDADYTSIVRKKRSFFASGDRVITKNRMLGTVDYADKDEQGEFIVVQLDNMPGTYAFEALDIEKV